MSVIRTRSWSSLGSGLLWAIALSGCGTLPATSVANHSNPAAINSDAVQSLQQQIKERDKRIAELTSQIKALKAIDQDMDERRKSRRPSVMLMPAATDPPR